MTQPLQTPFVLRNPIVAGTTLNAGQQYNIPFSVVAKSEIIVDYYTIDDNVYTKITDATDIVSHTITLGSFVDANRSYNDNKITFLQGANYDSNATYAVLIYRESEATNLANIQVGADNAVALTELSNKIVRKLQEIDSRLNATARLPVGFDTDELDLNTTGILEYNSTTRKLL